MFFVNRIVISLGCCILLQACTQIDDYMLGKDNTPVPSPLTELTSHMKWREKWSVPISKPSKASTYLKLKPVVRGDVVYTANANGMVQAIDKKSARILWSRPLSHGVVSGPTVASGYIAVGTDAATVVLLRQADGLQLWQVKLSSDALSKPVIVNQQVIVKTIDGNLYALDLKTGHQTWMTEHGSPSLILKASSSPVLVNQLILVGFSDGKLDAIDAQSGSVVWQRSIAFASGSSDVERLVDIDADPIIRGDVAYLASYQGYVGALSLSNGQFVWRKPASIYKNMAMDSSTLYVTDSDDVLWAFDRQNGQVKWKQPALKARGLTEPVLLGNRLIVGDRTGLLHVLATQNGDFIARISLKSPIDIAPVVSGHQVYVMTANGILHALVLAK